MKGNKNQIINWLLEQPDNLKFEIKECREKRSLNANSFLWVLMQRIADVLSSTKEEVYKEIIKDKGIFKTIEVSNNAVGTICTAWKNNGLGFNYEVLHEGLNTTEIILYYGTSVYNTKQMANLLDYVVDQCKEMGIETATPEELSRLKDNWRN